MRFPDSKSALWRISRAGTVAAGRCRDTARTDKILLFDGASNVTTTLTALKGDAAFLENSTTDDYTAVGGMGNVMSRSDAIQMRKSGDVKYSSIDVSDKKVRVYGNSAVLTATADIKGSVKDKDISGKYRIGQVWVKQGGKWKIAHMQSTKVQEGS